MKTTLDAWTDICSQLFSSLKSRSVHPIHSCVINKRRHFIHAPELHTEDPRYYQKLKEYAKRHNAILRADRRNLEAKQNTDRRKKLLPVIFLAIGISGERSFAESVLNTNPLPQFEIAQHATRSENSTPQTINQLSSTSKLSHTIENILVSHFAPAIDDPISIASDIKRAANYYASHPEAVELIESIAEESWQLKYAPHTFQTNVTGSKLNLQEINIYFDPRSTAQLKFYDRCSTKTPFCIASPADALLHELLHVQATLKNEKVFIAQGGLPHYMYRAEHERLTILKENILYMAMSIRDKKPRPIRSEYSGRHVLVSCVTCID